MSIHQRIRFLLIACLVFGPWAYSAEVQANWREDFTASVSEATAAGKPVLLLFTGSDWCPPCKMMESRVFASEAFVEYANEHLVLVEADFPRRTPQEAELKERNAALAEKFGIEAFPTILLLSPSGDRILSKTVGAQYTTPDAFIGMMRKALSDSQK